MNHHAILSLAVLMTSCSATDQELSEQAVELSLRRQATIALDEQLARQLQEILDGAWSLDETLKCIDATPEYVRDRLYASEVPPSAAAAWSQGTVLTGEPALDDLLIRYDVIAVEFSQESQDALLTLERPVKVELLAPMMSSSVANLVVEAQSWPGEFDDILIDGGEINTYVTFESRWGDCVAGCINFHFWRVEVSPDSPPVLIDSGGDEIPGGHCMAGTSLTVGTF